MSDEELRFVLNQKIPIDERWKTFQVYWKRTKNTAYAHCIRISARDLFGVEDINENTYNILDEKLLASNHKGWYRYVLKDRARIDVSIVDPLSRYIRPDDEYSDKYFLKVKKFDPFVMAGKDEISTIGKQHGLKIHNLQDYLNIFDATFKKAVLEEHIAGVKTTIAYDRSLYFEDVPQSTAENVFRRVFLESEELTPEEKKSLQDFLMHHLVQLTMEYGLPIQIHTGMLSQTWRENPIQNTNAALLTNLFFKYRRAKFVIFHGNYPYMGALAYLAKAFPNVYIDMCWMHIISPPASKKFLEEWLLTVPANKIMAFGGDILKSVEWVYGHSIMARGIVTEVLTKMVEEGYYSIDEAIAIAKMILRTNALELYNIRKSGDHFSIEQRHQQR
jgi:hypothetical protein